MFIADTGGNVLIHHTGIKKTSARWRQRLQASCLLSLMPKDCVRKARPSAISMRQMASQKRFCGICAGKNWKDLQRQPRWFLKYSCFKPPSVAMASTWVSLMFSRRRHQCLHYSRERQNFRQTVWVPCELDHDLRVRLCRCVGVDRSGRIVNGSQQTHGR
jgi:hypothetical protein